MEQKITKILSGVFKGIDMKDVNPLEFVQMFLLTHADFMPLGTQHDSEEFMQKILEIIGKTSPSHEKILKDLFEI